MISANSETTIEIDLIGSGMMIEIDVDVCSLCNSALSSLSSHNPCNVDSSAVESGWLLFKTTAFRKSFSSDSSMSMSQSLI